MSSIISPIPRIPGPGGSWIIFEFLKKIGKALGSIFKSPKKKETPEDVAERNRAFLSFCEEVNKEAKQVEEYVLQQIDEYIRYLDSLNSSGEYPFIQRYRINLRGTLRQVELLKTQIPGIIGNEVSRRLSDTDAECMRVRRMLPGAEKESQMQTLLQSIISSALEKCAATTASVIGEIQDGFIDDLQDCLHTANQQYEKTELELERIKNSEDDIAERVRIRAEAEHVMQCCDLALELME